jgi:soluble lytic murein transglycosylase-like protein
VSSKRNFAIVAVLVAFSAATVAQAAAPVGVNAPTRHADRQAQPTGPALGSKRSLEAAALRLRDRIQAARKKHVEKQREQAFAPSGGSIKGVSLATLNSIAACESGGDPTAVNAAGYYGKYQFDTGTWASVGGSGNPAEASEAEQDYRAALLYSSAGSSPWPVCGA